VLSAAARRGARRLRSTPLDDAGGADASAMGRSNDAPALRTSAGEDDRSCAALNPELRIASRTRSQLGGRSRPAIPPS
jgi:hypothetical protein